VLFVPAMVAAYSIGTILLQLGFQRGGALTTAGMTTLFTNALPIIAGTTLYAEPFPDGELGVLRGIAFAFLILGAVLLSRSKAPEPERRPELELAGA
jgi:membrane-bound ClpP family serine protease